MWMLLLVFQLEGQDGILSIEFCACICVTHLRVSLSMFSSALRVGM